MRTTIHKDNKNYGIEKTETYHDHINTSKEEPCLSCYQDSCVLRERERREREGMRGTVIRVFMELHKKGKGYIFIPRERYTTFCEWGLVT